MPQRLFKTICLALLVAASLSGASAQDQLPDGVHPPFTVRRPRPVDASYAIRVINAAESAYRQSHRQYGSWQDLYVSGVLWDVQAAAEPWHIVLFATGPEAIPGYHLTLLVSADGSAYSVALRDTDSNGCGLSLFSDQNGLIYQGSPLGCSKTAATSWPPPWILH